MAELRGKRFIDHQKDTQFTDAWIILGILLTIAGLIAAQRVSCWPARSRCLSFR